MASKKQNWNKKQVFFNYAQGLRLVIRLTMEMDNLLEWTGLRTLAIKWKLESKDKPLAWRHAACCKNPFLELGTMTWFIFSLTPPPFKGNTYSSLTYLNLTLWKIVCDRNVFILSSFFCYCTFLQPSQQYIKILPHALQWRSSIQTWRNSGPAQISGSRLHCQVLVSQTDCLKNVHVDAHAMFAKSQKLAGNSK